LIEETEKTMERGRMKEQGGRGKRSPPLPLVVWLRNEGKGDHHFVINLLILPYVVHNNTQKNFKIVQGMEEEFQST
jgi:hypothetical protein